VDLLENEPDETSDEDKQFDISIDDSILNEALASVEKRMGRKKRSDQVDVGPLDLSALAAMEEELAIEIEEEEDTNAPASDPSPHAAASVEARLRAMEAEQEAENLRDKLEGLSENRDNIEHQLRTLSSRAQKAGEAQRAAEKRSHNLKDALEKQQRDVERLLERRKKDKSDEYNRGRAAAIEAMADVIDNFHLALSHDDGDPAKLLEGVRMCLGQFDSNLSQAGVETIAPEPGDVFNPELHEAIANEDADGIEPGHIISIMSRGYMAGGKLIRAARVCVAKG